MTEFFKSLLISIIFVFQMSAQTSIVKDNLVGKADGIPFLNAVDNLISVYKGKIVFCGTNKFADLSTEGDYEPWIYDPANNTMSILKDIIPLRPSVPNKFVVSGDKLFFGARDQFFLSDQVFVSNGTPSGTLNLADTTNGLIGMLRNFSRNTIASLNNGIIFNGYISKTEYGLWYSDGTRNGTLKINESGFADNFVLHPTSQKVIFTQDSKFKISDGTKSGTKDLNDLTVISAVSTQSIGMGLYKNSLIVEGLDPRTTTFGLFISDGINSTYTKIIDFGDFPTNVRNVVDIGNNHCMLSNKNGLYSTDGTINGFTNIPNIIPFKSDNFYTDLWTVYKGKMYFAASEAINNKGVELYVSDGTVAGTKLFMDINAGIADANPFNFKVYNDILYFSANTATTGNELWLTDGTVQGTKMIADINVGNGSSNPQYMTGLGSELYFAATDGKTGYELWKLNTAKVAVENVNHSQQLFVYPTVGNGNLTISGDLSEVKKIVISNCNGGTVRLINEIENNINLEKLKLEKGNYFISFYNNSQLLYSQSIQIVK
ncbi:MAG: ELWxxDGT repeat protein [Saprospiraceae bacterium]